MDAAGATGTAGISRKERVEQLKVEVKKARKEHDKQGEALKGLQRDQNTIEGLNAVQDRDRRYKEASGGGCCVLM